MEKINVLPLLEGLGRTSLQAGVLVMVVLAVQWLLKKQLAPRWRCALWLLVVARLLLPVSVASTASIFNLMPPWAAHAQSGYHPPARPSVPDSATASPLLLQTREPMSSQDPAELPAILKDSGATHDSSLDARPAAVQPIPIGPRSQPFSWTKFVFWGWIGGVFAMGAYVLLASLSLARRFAGLKPLTGAALQAALEDCQLRMKVQISLTVVESGAVSCPALYGLFRPRLVLPAGFSNKFSERELRFIFLHELAHLKRFDLPMNWVIAGLQVLHWFNPLIWIGFACWRADRELACDAMALDAAGTNQNSEYGQTILRLLAGFTHASPAPGLVGILESKQQLRRRIGMIATYVPGRRWHLLALFVASAIGVTCLTDAQIKSPKSTIKKDTILVGSSAQTNQSVAVGSRPVVTNGPVMKVVVLDDATGKPVGGAEVLAPNEAAFFNGQEHAPLWLTDNDGRANIRLGEVPTNHLAEQSWFTLSVRHRGFAPRGMSWSAPNKDVRPSLPAEVVVRLKKGIGVGGMVRNEKGAPVSGLHVRVFGTAYWEGFKQEYPEYWTDGPDRPQVITDDQGRWEARDFPSDLGGVVVEFIQPDGSLQRFRKPYAGWENDTREPGEPIDLQDFRAGKALFVLKSGLDVRGVAVDPEGNPVPNLLVKAGTGAVNHQRLPDFRTDAAGRFQVRHLLRRQLILTAYPTNFAIVSTVVEVTPNTPEVELRLKPQRPLRIQVLNGKGSPVMGARVNVDGYRTEGQMLDFEGETDQNGILVWTNAPLASFALVASSASPKCRQKIRLTPEEREITFRLRDGMNDAVIVTGQVRDATTGGKVELESVNYRAAGGFNGFEFAGETENDGFHLSIPAARFTPGGMYPSYQIKLQLKGYGLLITPWRDFDEGDWDSKLVIQPSTVSSRTIFLPNGEPAANARVWTRADMNDGWLHCHSPNSYSDERLIKLRANADGKFNLPSIPDDEPLVVSHPDGFLETSLAELKDKSAMQLQPWGRIEGVLKVGSQPKGGARVNLTTLLSAPSRALFVSVLTTTASDGSFVFSDVPAGEYKLWRYLVTRPAGSPSRAITEDHQMPVAVRPGETVTIQYGGSGRPVIGQAKADKADITVDWLNDDHKLTLKQEPIPHLNLEDFADSETYMQAYRTSYASPEQMKVAREVRTYLLEFEPDGSFRAEDVPPGTYELSIQVNKPGDRPQYGPLGSAKGDLGSLVREVVVPPGNSPFDLGTLVVPVKGETGVKKTAPVRFTATTFDHKPISLDQFHGKYLVMAFWGSWSERSLEGLAELQKLKAQFAKNSRIDFLAVSVDQNAEDARSASRKSQNDWKQAWLPPESAAQVTATFDINTLPAVFLIDPDGRILGRDLEGERLRAMLNRALAAKQEQMP